MAFQALARGEGWQPIADTSTTQNHRIGQRIHAWDDTYGFGEFIYAKGVASTVVGDVCTIDTYGNASIRAVTGGTSFGPAGVVMSANVASQYGWYQIWGIGVVKAATVAAGAMAQITATAGTVDDTTTATRYIEGMLFQSTDGTPAAGFALVFLSYPFLALR